MPRVIYRPNEERYQTLVGMAKAQKTTMTGLINRWVAAGEPPPPLPAEEDKMDLRDAAEWLLAIIEECCPNQTIVEWCEGTGRDLDDLNEAVRMLSAWTLYPKFEVRDGKDY